MIKRFEISDALSSLRPNSPWIVKGDEYDGIEWLDQENEKPSKEEVEKEIARLQAEYDKTVYRIHRVKEYPDFKEYLDGIVKGDDAQIQAYIDACLAVKAKYPKPE
jgi:hypothetical protein